MNRRVGLAGTALVAVSFGMARYAFGLTLPEVSQDLGLSQVVLGLIASGTFVGHLSGLLLAGPLARRLGPRAPTTVGAACGATGALTVLFARSPEVLAAGTILAGSAGGWVWASYSDIVTRTVDRQRQPRILATISTGTAGGLIGLGALAILAEHDSWRLVWAGVALSAVAAAVLNVSLVPRLEPDPTGGSQAAERCGPRALLAPVSYSAVFFASVVVYLTYATSTLERNGAAGTGVPLLYVLVGATGLVALASGSMARRLGTARLAGLCLLTVAGALALLATGGDHLPAIAASGALLGIGLMTGSAVLAIWTAELSPDRAGAAFTTCLVAGAISAAAAPAAAGALVANLGVATVLAHTATVVGVSGLALLLRYSHQRAGPASRSAVRRPVVERDEAGVGATGSTRVSEDTRRSVDW